MSAPLSWNDLPVLVTGGAGFVASNLAHALIEKGARVTIVDIKPSIPAITGHYANVANKATYISADIANAEAVDAVFQREPFAAVFHLAAEAIVQRFHANPVRGLESNIQGTWNVLDAVRRFAPEAACVIASSDKAYGAHDILPYDESAALQGRNPYDASKSCTDLIGHMYAHAYGLKLLVTRCGNIYGPGDLNFSRLIPDTIRAALKNTPVVLRSDGKFLRDYVFVDDAVAAYLCCADALRNGHTSGEAYNFSHNAPISAIDTVRTVLRLMQADSLEPVIQNTAKFEIRDQYLDARKAMAQLAWQPSIKFEEGLTRTIEWYRMLLDQHPDYAA